MIAAQAARAAHLRAEERQKEELKRSKLALGEQGEHDELKPADETYVPVPPYYTLVPLQDNDCGEDDPSTFLVVASKFGKQCVYRFHASRSLWLFSPRNPIRRFVLFLITHQLFELIVLLTILTNCVFLAMSDPPEEAEYVFAAIYTIEMILKIIGRGFALHKYAYLRNAWNWLDFSVVVLGYVTMIPPFDQLSAMKTFRVLRALRTISAVKGLKAMVNTLLKSIKMLSDVLILTIFFLCVFALIGLQLFVGIMGQKCVKNGWPDSHEKFATYIINETNWRHFNGIPVICGNSSSAYQCPVNYTCLQNTGANPVSRFISYDNFGWSLLTSLQLVTMDYWESIYNSVIAAKGPWYIFYFLFVIFFGPFYLINLVLAVVSLSYEQETAALQDEELKAQVFAKLKRSASTYSFDGKTEPIPLYPEDVVNPEDLPAIEEPSRVEITQEQEEEQELEAEEKEPTSCDEFQKRMRSIVNHSAFETLITLCILFNTLAMALEHHNMDKTFSKTLEIFNLIFTAVFILEMIMKLSAFGLKAYVKNKWNLFDGTIVILSVVDMALTYTKTISGAGLSVLRTFRLLRVLKLAQSWKTMGDLLNTIGSSVGAVGNITVILGIIVYMFAVIGMQVFKTYYKPEKFSDNKIPRWNFDNFGHSFMMVFRILCGKWIEPLWDTMHVTSAIAIVFILPAFVIGNFVILNLFLALLLNSFGGEEELSPEEQAERERKKQEKIEKKKKKKRMKKFKSKLLGSKKGSGSRSKVGPDGEDAEEREGSVGNEEGKHEEREKKKDAALSLASNPANGDVITKQPSYEMNKLHNGNNHKFDETPGKPIGYNTKVNSVPPENRYSLTSARDLDEAAYRIREVTEENSKPVYRNRVKSEEGLDSTDNLNNGDLVTNGSAPIANGNSRVSAGSDRSHKDLSIGDIDSRITSGSLGRDLERRDTIVTMPEERIVQNCCPDFCYSSGTCCKNYKDSCFRQTWHRMRYKVCAFVEHKHFESFILVMIVISSLTLAVEDVDLPTRPVLKSALNVLNYIFAVTFCVEFLLKIFGMGVVGYFSNLWNCLDSFIVAISLASISGNEKLNAFRSLRALRPLRAISRFEGMKIVVNSLVHAVPAIVNVMLVCLVFWLIFSIVGYQLFGGKFFKCVYNETLEKVDPILVPNKSFCNESLGMRWTNSKINFDSSIQGFLALFQVATLEGVFEVMVDSADATEVDQQPVYEASFYANFYYVVFIILGSFFILNLFIGVIIENFNRLKQEYEDSGALGCFLTPSQRNWVNAIKKTYNRKPKKQPKKPTNAIRMWLFDLIALRKFEIFIMTVILVNMLTMMMEHHNQSPDFTDALRYLNYIFTGIFIIEACIRLIALRLDYFKQGWNVFDFTIVVFSIVGIIVEDVLKQEMIFSPGLLRVVRCFRLGRLLRFFEGAKGIRRLLFALIKSVPGLANIAMLLGLIIFIYAIIGMSSFGYVKKTNGIDEVVNFERFGSSMLLLFRIGTAAGWNTILDPIMIQPPDCDPDFVRPNGASGKGNCGSPYLAVPYFVSYILVVFLIVINMYIAVILENFNEAQQQEEIGLTDDDLETFVQIWEEYDPTASLFIDVSKLSDFLDDLEPPLQIPKPNRHLFGELKVPLKEDGRVYVLDLMQVLVRRRIGKVEDFDEDEIMAKLEEKFKTREVGPTVSTTAELFYHDVLAAMCIQRAVRRYLIGKRMNPQQHNDKFHRYNQGDKGKGDMWKEKHIVQDDHSTDGAKVGGLIANMWLNQARHIEDQLTSGISGISGSDTEAEDTSRVGSATVPTLVVSSDNEIRNRGKVTNC